MTGEKTIQFIFLSILLLAISVQPAFAAKKRVRGTAQSTRAVGISYSSARLSRETNSVIVSFSNLSSVQSLTYMLSYTANGIEQGVGGSITPKGVTDSRDLYLGTCSHGVCTPHYNIKNAKLTITTTLSSGATHVKLYRIKV